MRATEKFDLCNSLPVLSFLSVCSLMIVHQWLAKSNGHCSLVMYIVASQWLASP